LIEAIRSHSAPPANERPAEEIFRIYAGVLALFFGVQYGCRFLGIPGLILYILGFPVVMMAMLHFARLVNRRRTLNAVEELSRAKGRKPVVYLRSFAFENLSDESGWKVAVRRCLRCLLEENPFSIPEDLADRFDFGPTPGNVFEIKAAEVFRRIGPVVAIGRPGESLPLLGAARLYVSHENWQAVVGELTVRAQLVAWVTGTTGGLQWELEHLLGAIPPDKLLVLVHAQIFRDDPERRDREWQTVVDKLGPAFPKGLPTNIGEAWVIRFGPGWEPITFEEPAPSWSPALPHFMRDYPLPGALIRALSTMGHPFPCGLDARRQSALVFSLASAGFGIAAAITFPGNGFADFSWIFYELLGLVGFGGSFAALWQAQLSGDLQGIDLVRLVATVALWQCSCLSSLQFLGTVFTPMNLYARAIMRIWGGSVLSGMCAMVVIVVLLLLARSDLSPWQLHHNALVRGWVVPAVIVTIAEFVLLRRALSNPVSIQARSITSVAVCIELFRLLFGLALAVLIGLSGWRR
jgi:hypothetical protein